MTALCIWNRKNRKRIQIYSIASSDGTFDFIRKILVQSKSTYGKQRNQKYRFIFLSFSDIEYFVHVDQTNFLI